MEINFNFIKNFINIDASIFSPGEITVKAVWQVLINSPLIFAGVTTTTLLANKKTFPLHKLLQSVKSFVGGDWLNFVLEFEIILVWMFQILALLLLLILSHRFIRSRDYCYGFFDTLIDVLANLKCNFEYHLDYICYWWATIYCYLSTLYTSYLIMATANFSELYLLIVHDTSMTIAVLGTLMMLLAVFINFCEKVGHFLGISD